MKRYLSKKGRRDGGDGASESAAKARNQAKTSAEELKELTEEQD